MRQGLSLETRTPARQRPPSLPHSATVDCPPHFRPLQQHQQQQHRQHRPPLRKSIRIDQSADTPPEDAPPDFESPWGSTPSLADGRRPASFDSACPRNSNTAHDKSSLSATNVIVLETTNKTNPSDKVTYDKHSSFRSTRMRGTSSDRIIAKKRHDQKSVSSLGDRTTDSAGTTSLFEKHLGKFYKLSKFEKQKRSSANTLCDDSPTEAFYNKTGSARLSSQELFEKFCSEDFVSLYGHENDNGNYSYYTNDDYGHSKSLESAHMVLQSKYYTSDEAQDQNVSLSHASLGAIKKTRKLDGIHAGKRFDYSTESNFRMTEKRTHFSFDVPFSLPPNITNIIDGSDESLDDKDHSRSAPLLSPDKEGLQFNFDVAELSKTEDLDESPSDATETRNLTLYEEPHSDRTSLSDAYEPCFSSGFRSARSSIKRDLIYKNQPVFDLTNLDFRPIDDESPNTSKFVSISSPDEFRSNFDTKSYYSDSVFASPEKMSSSKDESTKITAKRKAMSEELLHASERSDSTTLEEEPTSIMDKIPEIFVERYDLLSVDYSNTESRYDPTERTLSPLFEQAVESKSDSINLSESSLSAPELTKLIASRPSMHKLEPFYPRNLSNDNEISKVENENEPEVDKYDKVTEQYDKVLDLPRTSGKRERSMFFKMKKVRDTSTANIHRRTRCFPL